MVTGVGMCGIAAQQRTGCRVHKARSEALHDELPVDPVW